MSGTILQTLMPAAAATGGTPLANAVPTNASASQDGGGDFASTLDQASSDASNASTTPQSNSINPGATKPIGTKAGQTGQADADDTNTQHQNLKQIQSGKAAPSSQAIVNPTSDVSLQGPQTVPTTPAAQLQQLQQATSGSATTPSTEPSVTAQAGETDTPNVPNTQTTPAPPTDNSATLANAATTAQPTTMISGATTANTQPQPLSAAMVGHYSLSGTSSMDTPRPVQAAQATAAQTSTPANDINASNAAGNSNSLTQTATDAVQTLSDIGAATTPTPGTATISPGKLNRGSDTASANADLSSTGQSVADAMQQLANQPQAGDQKTKSQTSVKSTGTSNRTDATSASATSAGTIPVSTDTSQAATDAVSAMLAAQSTAAQVQPVPSSASNSRGGTTGSAISGAKPSNAAATPQATLSDKADAAANKFAATLNNGATDGDSSDASDSKSHGLKAAPGTDASQTIAALNSTGASFDSMVHASADTSDDKATTHAAPAEQIAVRLATAVAEGQRSVTVELRPEALGRVEVRLNFRDDNSVGVQMTMDRHDTYQAFRNNQAGLEHQLSQAGLNLGGGSLDLRFNQDQQQQQQQDSSRQSQGNSRFVAQLDESDTDPVTESPVRNVQKSLVDIEA